MKIALVHDWLTGMRGGEKCLEALCELFPQADIYTLISAPDKLSDTINKMRIYTSPLQKIPFSKKYYRKLLPVLPNMIEGFYLENYDLVISLSHCVAKGIRIKSGTKHICYCFTPMRYIWDLYEDYYRESSLITKLAMTVFKKSLRYWDLNSSKNVNDFIAISNYIKERIKRMYDRDSTVIYPPVDTDKYCYNQQDTKQDYYLLAGAFAAYKRVDIAVRVFNKLGKKLFIIGNGQEFEKIKRLAKNNIQFLGWVSDHDLRRYYTQSRALIFPSDEDFGIVPVEAMACGTPVIAYKKGGALETVINNKTGIFFDEQSEKSLADAILEFESAGNFDKQIIREHALFFSKNRYKEQMLDHINKLCNQIK